MGSRRRFTQVQVLNLLNCKLFALNKVAAKNKRGPGIDHGVRLKGKARPVRHNAILTDGTTATL